MMLGSSLQKYLGLNSVDFSSNVIRKIERVTSTNRQSFEDLFDLYVYSFPNPDERESPEEIEERLTTYSSGPDVDGTEFHVHVYLDSENRVMAYSQGSIISCGEQLLAFFWQYGAVADEQFLKTRYGISSTSARGGGISKLIHTINILTLQVASKRFNKTCYAEIWETEQKGLGYSPAEICFSVQRLKIHAKAGGKVLMGLGEKGLINLHVQPRLASGKDMIRLHLMVKLVSESNCSIEEIERISPEVVKQLLNGFFENFRREGFSDVHVREAELEVEFRASQCTSFVLLPESKLPNVVELAETDEFLQKQLFSTYNVQSLEDARQYLEAAFSNMRV